MTDKFSVFVFVAFFIGGGGGGGAHDDREMWQRNLDAMQAFACDRPRPRAFKADRLLTGKVERSDTIVPHTAILHRCDDDSGCCNDAYDACRVAETQEVQLVFVVHTKNKGERYEGYRGANHTKCACKAIATNIK